MENEKQRAVTLQKSEHDPYKIRSIEQLLALFDGGDFLADLMEENHKLKQCLVEHKATYGTKTSEGAMIIRIDYSLGRSGDVLMKASSTFNKPKTPASTAAAFIHESGDLTLYSPFLAKMQNPIRDV